MRHRAYIPDLTSHLHHGSKLTRILRFSGYLRNALGQHALGRLRYAIMRHRRGRGNPVPWCLRREEGRPRRSTNRGRGSRRVGRPSRYSFKWFPRVQSAASMSAWLPAEAHDWNDLNIAGGRATLRGSTPSGSATRPAGDGRRCQRHWPFRRRSSFSSRRGPCRTSPWSSRSTDSILRCSRSRSSRR